MATFSHCGSALDTYHIFSKYSVSSVDDLAGHKFAAPGPSANWVKGTGAVAVNSNLPEYYNSIQLGVFDGSLVFTSGAMGIKLFEVTPYVAMVNIGAQYAGSLAINKKGLQSKHQSAGLMGHHKEMRLSKTG